MLLNVHFALPQKQNSKHETFEFRDFEVTVLSPYQMIHVSQDNAQFVKTHIKNELESHGLVKSSSPDLYVDIFVTLRLQRQFSRGYFFGQPIYQVGTLTVRLIEATNDEVLWEGAKTIPLWKVKEKRLRKRVDNIVAKTFKDFDPSVL